MKIKITLIIVSLSSLFAFSQTVLELDKKNGFKDFILGDTFYKWQNQLNLIKVNDDETKTYLYKGDCCKKVFNYPIEYIALRFLKDKLIAIYIMTEKFQKPYKESGEHTKWRSSDFESINSSFSQIFGEHTSENLDNDITYIWKGNKVMLVSKYEYLGVNNGDRQNIVLIDIAALKELSNNGF